jgi:hypothetical protein
MVRPAFARMQCPGLVENDVASVYTASLVGSFLSPGPDGNSHIGVLIACLASFKSHDS